MRLSDIYCHALRTPDHLAVVNSGDEVSYREFAEMIEAARLYLMTQSIPQSGVVYVTAPSRLYEYVLQYAARALGYTTVATASLAVLASLRVGPLAAVISLGDRFDGLEGAPGPCRGALIVRVPVDLLRPHQGVAIPDHVTEPMPGRHILFTSGTTGTYKKVVYDDHLLDQRIRHAALVGIGYGPDDVAHFINYPPWISISGLSVSRAWVGGATVVFDQRQDWPRYFFDYPVTSTYLVNTQLTTFAYQAAPQPDDFPELQVRLGGGFPNAAALNHLRERFRCRALAMYGGTEFTAPIMAEVKTVDDMLWLGRAPGGEFQIVDDDDRPVPVGTEGILRVRLKPYEPKGYHDEPEATARHYRDGYFYPGDIAVERADGRVRIVGRQSEVIILAGRKVAVRPHEERFEAALGVDNVRLFSRQLDDGEHILLVVAECEQLPPRERMKGIVTAYRGDFDMVRVVNLPVFPRGSNGMDKVDRVKLLEMVGY